jgi:hypothetical protein
MERSSVGDLFLGSKKAVSHQLSALSWSKGLSRQKLTADC